MENLFKKEYEISLWDDVLYWHRRKLKKIAVTENDYQPGKYYSQSDDVSGAKPYNIDLKPYSNDKTYYELEEWREGNYLEGDSADSINIEANDPNWYENSALIPNVIVQFYKEKKICIIGSDTMETPIRAHNPKLVANTNGSSTLSFTIYYKYYDEESEDLVDNPFVKLLVNERKVKLRHGPLGAKDTKWYDFVIKNVQEDSESRAFTYTAKDLFINELSKSGFDIQLDARLENNQGTILELGRRVLEESDWQVPDDADVHLQQTKSEALYEFTTNKQIHATSMAQGGGTIDISAGEIIYGFYNCVAERLPYFQFLYCQDAYETDDERHIINSPNYYIDETEYTDNGFPSFTVSEINGEAALLTITTQYRGKRVVRQAKIVYDPIADRYVNVYKDEDDNEIYGYVDDEIISPSYVRNFVINSTDYDSLTGWAVSAHAEVQPALEMATIPDIFDTSYNKEVAYTSFLKVNFTNTSQGLVNFGLTENRSILNGFTKGQEFVLRMKYGVLNDGEVALKPDIKLVAKVFEYDLKNGVYQQDGDTILNFTTWVSGRNNDDKDYYVFRTSCLTSVSYTDMTKSKYALFISPESSDALNQDIYIQDVQLFYAEEVNSKLVYPGDVFDTNVIKQKYKYYYKPTGALKSDDIEYVYESTEPSGDYTQAYNNDTDYEKVRSITASESNRFNLIQELCEIFECWPKFTIDHNEDGSIQLDENFRQKKWVTFKEFIGKQNDIGFRYGINLKSIKRTIDSDNIVTKMIVKNNSNEYATDGFCSIARAQENPSRENFLLEFDYYISQGLMDFEQIWNDLYTKANGYIGYYVRLKEINIIEDNLIIEQSKLFVDQPNLESDVQMYENLLREANSVLSVKKEELYSICNLTFEQLVVDNPSEAVLSARDYPDVKAYCAAIAKLSNTVAIAEKNLLVAKENLAYNLANQKNIEEQLSDDRAEKLALDLQFYKKYSRFLQEGSWIEENYVDDNLYYLDAESTLYTSAHPKVTYDINVLELSRIPEYENYTFNLGDKTFIEDTEFFGWRFGVNGVRTPRREEIIVNEITIMLDSPEQNQIKVQNYKTQFEDLFQRITATTQAIEYSTGKYEKASSIVTTEGTIVPDTLANSMANNSFVISNARDQSVTWDESGITTVSLSSPSEMVRIVSGGIFLSKDGGTTWNTGITGNGINANYLTSGQIDTSKIRIMAGSFPSFRWDSTGLNAYEFELSEDRQTGINFNFSNYIRFDQYGLYGIKGISDFNPLVPDEKGSKGEDKIWKNARFALTWKGFSLKNDNGSVSITSDNDIQVLSEEKERVRIGRLGDGKYGIRIKDGIGDTVMETADDGKLWLRNRLNIETYGKQVGIGKLDTEESKDGKHGGRIIDADEKFVVYEDGHIQASSGVFGGMTVDESGSSFKGTITATGGTIGGLTIEELVSRGDYTVRIEGESGFVFRNGAGTKKFTFKLFKGDEDITAQVQQVAWYLNGKGVESTENDPKTVIINGSDIGESGDARLTCRVWINQAEVEE